MRVMICVRAETDALGIDKDKRPELTYGKSYKIIDKSFSPRATYFYLVNDRGGISEYLTDRFVTPEQWRDIRLGEIGII